MAKKTKDEKKLKLRKTVLKELDLERTVEVRGGAAARGADTAFPCFSMNNCPSPM